MLTFEAMIDFIEGSPHLHPPGIVKTVWTVTYLTSLDTWSSRVYLS